MDQLLLPETVLQKFEQFDIAVTNLSVVDNEEGFNEAKRYCRELFVEISSQVLSIRVSSLKHIFLPSLMSICTSKEVEDEIVSYRFVQAQEVSTKFSALLYALRCFNVAHYVAQTPDVTQTEYPQINSAPFLLDGNSAIGTVRKFLDAALETCDNEGGQCKYEDCFSEENGHGIGKCGLLDDGTHLSLSTLSSLVERVQTEYWKT